MDLKPPFSVGAGLVGAWAGSGVSVVPRPGVSDHSSAHRLLH